MEHLHFESNGVPDIVRALVEDAAPVAPALQSRKRAPDPVSGCSRASASAIQAPAPLAKKPRRSHARIESSDDEPLHEEPRRSRGRIESSDDEPLHEEYYASVYGQSVEPRREQSSELSLGPSNEAPP